MRKALIAAVFVAALVPAPASAGCWATVGLVPPPAGTVAGDVWVAEVTVLQHGRQPLPDAADATPKVTIVDRETGEKQTFAARSTDPGAGLYEAEVVFPSAGAWSYEVFDGFTSWNDEPAPCAQTHTFAAVQIGQVGVGGSTVSTEASSFPVWPIASGLGGLLVVAAFARRLVEARRARFARR